MTWSISFSVSSKSEAKRKLTLELPKAMLYQEPHAADFDLVKAAIDRAIDTCAEGVVSVSASGSLGGDIWGEGREVRSVQMTMHVYSKAE